MADEDSIANWRIGHEDRGIGEIPVKFRKYGSSGVEGHSGCHVGRFSMSASLMDQGSSGSLAYSRASSLKQESSSQVASSCSGAVIVLTWLQICGCENAATQDLRKLAISSGGQWSFAEVLPNLGR